MTLAERLTALLRGTWHGTYGTARCPAHKDKSPSLSIRDGDSAPLLKCHAGDASDDIIDALRRQGFWPVARIDTEKTRSTTRTDDRRDWALRIWRETMPIAGTIAERYLRGRGITIPLPPTLRYHRSLKHKGTGLLMPALVAGVHDIHGRVIAVQRTFLRSNGSGKANVSEPKMTLGAMETGAVQLGAGARVEEIGIAEGVETGLSVMQLFNVPVWCSLGKERLRRVELPPGIRHVCIYGDNGSETAAYQARDEYRHQGYLADVRFPAADFKDFNDVPEMKVLEQREATASA